MVYANATYKFSFGPLYYWEGANSVILHSLESLEDQIITFDGYNLKQQRSE